MAVNSAASADRRSADELDAFLATVEARALRVATIAVQHREDAFDIVQDAMLKLAERYGTRPASEWPPLFQTILHNRIRDWHRRQRLRRALFGWFDADPGGGRSDDDAHSESWQGQVVDRCADPAARRPEDNAQTRQALYRLETALAGLPFRQRQVFLLRAWEGLAVADAASAMGCSTGSVKSHYARALRALRNQLGDYWP